MSEVAVAFQYLFGGDLSVGAEEGAVVEDGLEVFGDLKGWSARPASFQADEIGLEDTHLTHHVVAFEQLMYGLDSQERLLHTFSLVIREEYIGRNNGSKVVDIHLRS